MTIINTLQQFEEALQSWRNEDLPTPVNDIPFIPGSSLNKDVLIEGRLKLDIKAGILDTEINLFLGGVSHIVQLSLMKESEIRVTLKEIEAGCDPIDVNESLIMAVRQANLSLNSSLLQFTLDPHNVIKEG